MKFRSGADPVLFLSNPEGFSREQRRTFLDALGELNRTSQEEFGDPEIAARVSQYEMAYRMQASVPELTDLSKEPAPTFELYGDDARKPGTFAANCVLARRLAERGVRFIQLYHRDWDHHGGLPEGPAQALQGCRPGLGRAGHRSRSSAACSTTRSSSGAASSAARSTARAA